MPNWISSALLVCLILTLLLAVADYFRHRSWRRLLGYAFSLAVAASLYFMMAIQSSKQAFGGASPMLALALMFTGVIFGIGATYIFNLSGAFSWRDFARPIVVSPLVLLPLIGSLQGAALEPVQLVCFTVLAFQNGFFWQQVLRDAKATT